MRYFLFSILSIAFIPLSYGQSICENGRLFAIDFPTCMDKTKPKELTVSCRDESHGLESTPTGAPRVVRNFTHEIPGGSGKTQDQHCLENQAFIVGALTPLQTVRFLGSDPALETSSGGNLRNGFRTQYRYFCRFEVDTFQYVDKVSAACVPEDQRYEKTQGSVCLSADQKTLLEAIHANGGYDAVSLKLYSASFETSGPLWTELTDDSEASLIEEPAATLCTTCEDLSADLTREESLEVNLQCLKSLVQVFPFRENLTENELNRLQDQAQQIKAAIVVEKRITESAPEDVPLLDFLIQ